MLNNYQAEAKFNDNFEFLDIFTPSLFLQNCDNYHLQIFQNGVTSFKRMVD